MKQQFNSYLLTNVIGRTVLVLGIVIVGFLVVGRAVVRWDLTEDKRFSISEASHKLAQGLEDPLTIRAYFNAEVPPRIAPFKQQVFDILSEYEAVSGGRIKVEHYDPTAKKAIESEAADYGIQPVAVQVFEGSGAQSLNFYGGIVLLYRERASEVINVAQRIMQGYEGLSVLEYEISSRIWQLTHEKPKVGLTGYMQTQPQRNQFGGPPQPSRNEFQGLRRLLGEACELEDVDLKTAEPDPSEMPLLLVVRPKEMADVEVFRLDQYLMKGGRAIVFVTLGELQQAPFGGGGFTWRGFKSGLERWLAHHGVRVSEEFVCHAASAAASPRRVTLPGGLQAEMMQPNWFWPRFSGDMLDPGNPAVRTLKSVVFLWPHPVDVIESAVGAKKTATALVKSDGRESWRWKDTNRVDINKLDPRYDGPSREDLMSSNVAVALEGEFVSYFADRPVPPSLITAGEEKDGDEKGENAPKAPEVVKVSKQSTQLVVVGNSIFISDAVLGGKRAGDQRARQAALLATNLVDWLARSKDLIALRAKQFANRQLEDPDFKEAIEELNELADKGEVEEREFLTRLDEAREDQKSRRSYWRWLNVLAPAAFVIVLGFVVWILRAAMRAGSNRAAQQTAMVEPSGAAPAAQAEELVGDTAGDTAADIDEEPKA